MHCGNLWEERTDHGHIWGDSAVVAVGKAIVATVSVDSEAAYMNSTEMKYCGGEIIGQLRYV
jgi:hypothetical protein